MTRLQYGELGIAHGNVSNYFRDRHVTLPKAPNHLLAEGVSICQICCSICVICDALLLRRKPAAFVKQQRRLPYRSHRLADVSSILSADLAFHYLSEAELECDPQRQERHSWRAR